jgi:hypothetical protein
MNVGPASFYMLNMFAKDIWYELCFDKYGLDWSNLNIRLTTIIIKIITLKKSA